VIHEFSTTANSIKDLTAAEEHLEGLGIIESLD